MRRKMQPYQYDMDGKTNLSLPRSLADERDKNRVWHLIVKAKTSLTALWHVLIE